jgi:hypothetical protein
MGDLMSRVTNDVDTLNQLLSQGITQLLGSFFSLIGIVVAMLILDWRLALVCFTIIPVMILVNVYFARRARRAFRTTRETVGDVTAGLQEEIVGVREAQAFNRTEANIERFRERNAANRTANVQAVAITSAFAPAIDVLSTLATAVVIGYGGYLVVSGTLTVGLLTAFLIYVQQFFRPIQLASQVYTQAQAALAGGERIYNILDEEPEPSAPPGTPKLDSVEGRIEFENVSFAYEPDRPVLQNVDFQGRGRGRRSRWSDRLGRARRLSPTSSPLLRRERGRGAGGRPGRARGGAAEPAGEDSDGPPGTVPFLRDRRGEHLLRQAGRHREEIEAAAYAVSAHSFIVVPAERLRHTSGRRRRELEPGTAPTPLLRPGGAGRSAHPHPGRGDEQR